jgi:hypothetical protein
MAKLNYKYNKNSNVHIVKVRWSDVHDSTGTHGKIFLDDHDIEFLINQYECSKLTQEQIDSEFSGEVF